MARKSERAKKKPDVLHYTHLTSAEKMRRSRSKLNRQKKEEEKTDRKSNAAKIKITATQ